MKTIDKFGPIFEAPQGTPKTIATPFGAARVIGVREDGEPVFGEPDANPYGGVSPSRRGYYGEP